MAIKRLDKLPKRKLTIDEILRSDDISDLLKDLYDKRHEIDQFVLIYTDHEAIPHFYWHGNRERIVYALEQGKLKVLTEKEEDE